MKGVMCEIPERLLEWRSRTGADRWDEKWEGVLHMPPMPSRSHQDLEGALEHWLRTYWAEPLGNKVYHQINVASPGRWPEDYRIPDLVLLTPDRFSIDRDEYFDGAPSVVVEIRSPRDETCEKLPFYAGIGVPEVWIIDRDTKVPGIYLLQGDDYEPASPDAQGWARSPLTSVRLRQDPSLKLGVRLGEDAQTERLLPEG